MRCLYARGGCGGLDIQSKAGEKGGRAIGMVVAGECKTQGKAEGGGEVTVKAGGGSCVFAKLRQGLYGKIHVKQKAAALPLPLLGLGLGSDN
jgi:hypothetical protein